VGEVVALVLGASEAPEVPEEPELELVWVEALA